MGHTVTLTHLHAAPDGAQDLRVLLQIVLGCFRFGNVVWGGKINVRVTHDKVSLVCVVHNSSSVEVHPLSIVFLLVCLAIVLFVNVTPKGFTDSESSRRRTKGRRNGRTECCSNWGVSNDEEKRKGELFHEITCRLVVCADLKVVVPGGRSAVL